MDNKTEYFTLKEDGVIGWIENMPEEPNWQSFKSARGTEHTAKEIANIKYKQALQSAISNAIEVSNPEEVKVHIFRTNPGLQYILENTPYTLQCHVEKVDDVDFDMVDPFGDYNIRTVALVTFPEPSAGVEETQEQIFDELLSKYFKIVRSDYGSGWLAVQELMNEFTITRKNP